MINTVNGNLEETYRSSCNGERWMLERYRSRLLADLQNIPDLRYDCTTRSRASPAVLNAATIGWRIWVGL